MVRAPKLASTRAWAANTVFPGARKWKDGKSTISAWDPYTHFGRLQGAVHRVRPRRQASGNRSQRNKIAVDYYIEAIGDGMTRLRLVQSGFGPEAAWDDEIESIKTGWADFLKKLKEVLEG